MSSKRPPGTWKSKTYRIWIDIRQRCQNPKNKRFKDYGARGIYVCDSWRDFDNFLADMGIRPNGKTLERVNNDGPYSPDNCIWATRKQQQRNRRTNHRLTIQGITYCLTEWAEKMQLSVDAVRSRVKLGWTVKEILTTAVIPTATTEERRQKCRARQCVRRAVGRGQLLRATRCAVKGCSRKDIEAHHHKGYEPENALDVLWVCRKHQHRHPCPILRERLSTLLTSK